MVGWSDEALDMLELAEVAWSRDQNRLDRHERLVRVPMVALCQALADEFGDASRATS